MLIGVHGRLGSGKDTVFQRAEQVRGSLGLPKPERLAFADKLKDSACAVLGITRDQMEDMKRDEKFVLTWNVQLDQLYPEEIGTEPYMTMRTFLQRYGTEAHREMFGDDFWVKATLPDGFDHTGRLVMVTDVRFPNEAFRITELGGFVVEVTDGQYIDTYEHASEKPFDREMIDYQIVNDVKGDHFVTLDARVREMLEQLIQWDGHPGIG